jgi:hypothetical protein
MMKIELDLDEVFPGDELRDTVGEIVRDEVRALILHEVQRAIQIDKDLLAAVRRLRDKNMKEITAALP